mmetsp:Transcript_12867/g.36407  ORF Transcript_12867/g.36407 Transcript_12867/m.36407 type:complete len:451 (-) Transcript_12867:241-1593(-)
MHINFENGITVVTVFSVSVGASALSFILVNGIGASKHFPQGLAWFLLASSGILYLGLLTFCIFLSWLTDHYERTSGLIFSVVVAVIGSVLVLVHAGLVLYERTSLRAGRSIQLNSFSKSTVAPAPENVPAVPGGSDSEWSTDFARALRTDGGERKPAFPPVLVVSEGELELSDDFNLSDEMEKAFGASREDEPLLTGIGAEEQSEYGTGEANDGTPHLSPMEEIRYGDSNSPDGPAEDSTGSPNNSEGDPDDSSGSLEGGEACSTTGQASSIATQWEAWIGNGQRLSPELYETLLQNVALVTVNPYSKPDSHNVLRACKEMIANDLPRTIPSPTEVGEEALVHVARILEAWALYRPDIGYVQGMSSLCMMLYLVMRSEYRTFRSLANLILGSTTLRILYEMSDENMASILLLFQTMLQEHASKHKRCGGDGYRVGKCISSKVRLALYSSS